MKLVAGAALAALALVLPASGATGFTPKTLAGTWTGSWVNETFGSTGPARIVIAAPKNLKLVITIDVGGSVGGCQDPETRKLTITKGKGANRWNAAGFRATQTDPVFGTATYTYTHATKKFRAGGTVGTCVAGMKWTMDGAVAGKAFAATLALTFANGSTAVAKLTLARP